MKDGVLDMSSRILSNPKHVFDCFLEVVGPQGEVSCHFTMIMSILLEYLGITTMDSAKLPPFLQR